MPYEASGRTVAAVDCWVSRPGSLSWLGPVLPSTTASAKTSAYDIEFVKKGRLLPAESAEDMPYFEEMVEAARDGGIQLEMLTKEQVKTRFPVVEGTHRGDGLFRR